VLSDRVELVDRGARPQQQRVRGAEICEGEAGGGDGGARRASARDEDERDFVGPDPSGGLEEQPTGDFARRVGDRVRARTNVDSGDRCGMGRDDEAPADVGSFAGRSGHRDRRLAEPEHDRGAGERSGEQRRGHDGVGQHGAEGRLGDVEQGASRRTIFVRSGLEERHDRYASPRWLRLRTTP
jgi:hypothetical protein